MRLDVADEGATIELAGRLADRLGPGDTVLLEGPLGAGKTVFARALIRRLTGDPGLVVPSPTFALVQPYSAAGIRLLHVDLYRIADVRETEELGLFDDADAIRLVEWPDRLPALAPMADFRVVLAQGERADDRRIDLEAARDPARLEGLE
jgi:tRNA threonylcarbamoyladenosine biosynthesis protein TsaE